MAHGIRTTAKIWASTGLALATTVGLGQASTWAPASHQAPALLHLAEGGEGGEGGGSVPDTYAVGSDDPTAYMFDAKPQVTAYAALVYASYADAKTQADALSAAVNALLANPSDATLKAARSAWVTARPAYLRTETFRFSDGPIEAIEGEINAWPMNEAYVDYVEGNPASGLINGSETLSPINIIASNQSSDEADVTTGWHAIEFLLWGQDLSASGPGNRPFTDYTGGKGNNDRRRLYLKTITEKLVADLQSLEQAWAPGVAGNYRARFEAMEQREALGRIVNGMAILAGFEFMSERLAVALDSGDQEDEHSCFSDTTKQDFFYDLDGIRRVWLETGLASLVASRDAAVAARVSASLDDARDRISALDEPWDQVLAAPASSTARKNAEALVTSLQLLADSLKKAGSSLGVVVLIPGA